jgi:hypothetical protein
MDFYAPDLKLIKRQKQLEKKLFNELVTNATKEYGTWEYKLNYLEKLLKYNHINEWEYTEKLNALKRQFDSSNYDSDDGGDELELIAETDTHTLLREDEPVLGFLSNGQPSYRYYVLTNERSAALDADGSILVDHTDSVFHIRNDGEAVTWFRNRYVL